MIRTETSIRVRYVETDAMGFVHHANYIPWLELARIEMLDKLGKPYKELEEEGFLLPVLDLRMEYKQPAFFDDRVIVVCMVKKKPGVRFRIHYDIYRDETLLCKGSSDHAFINKEGRPIRPPRTFVDLFKKALESNHSPQRTSTSR